MPHDIGQFFLRILELGTATSHDLVHTLGESIQVVGIQTRHADSSVG